MCSRDYDQLTLSFRAYSGHKHYFWYQYKLRARYKSGQNPHPKKVTQLKGLQSMADTVECSIQGTPVNTKMGD